MAHGETTIFNSYVSQLISDWKLQLIDLRKRVAKGKWMARKLAKRIKSEISDAQDRVGYETQLALHWAEINRQREAVTAYELKIEKANALQRDFYFSKEVCPKLAETFASTVDGVVPDQAEITRHWRVYLNLAIELSTIATSPSDGDGFEPFRNRLKSAEAGRSAIAKLARELASAIESTVKLGLEFPHEINEIGTLLSTAENDASWEQRTGWRWARAYLLKAPNREPSMVSKRLLGTRPKWRADEARFRASLWRFSPKVPTILNALAVAVERWEPAEGKSFSDALLSRKRNPKYEYFRAFVSHLIEEAVPINVTATAYTASVLLDQDIDPNEVSQAISRLKIRRQ